MNRHERRQQAKLQRSGGREDPQLWRTGLEAQARNWGFPSVESMVEAHFAGAKAIVDRLPDDPTLSIGDCYMICAAAFATAGGGPMQTFAAQLVMTLEPFIRKDRRPNAREEVAILAMVRKYLEAVEIRGAWSLEGVGELRLNDGENDVDLSAAALNPSVQVPREDICWLCKGPFATSDLVVVVPYDGAPPGWSTVQIHGSCESLLRHRPSGEPS